MPLLRLSGYAVILILILSSDVLQVHNPPTITMWTKPASDPCAAAPRQIPPPTVLLPDTSPVEAAPAPVEALTPFESSPSAVAPQTAAEQEVPVREAAHDSELHPELPVMRARPEEVREADSRLARHLDQRTNTPGNFPLLGESSADSPGGLALGRLQAGYGRIFPDASILARGRNGTAWEEPGCFYVKASFGF